MTTGTARLDMSTTFRSGERHGLGVASHGISRAVELVGRVPVAAVRWFQAGQLDASGSVELARWAGARR